VCLLLSACLLAFCATPLMGVMRLLQVPLALSSAAMLRCYSCLHCAKMVMGDASHQQVLMWFSCEVMNRC
jgi:hypothetical protein